MKPAISRPQQKPPHKSPARVKLLRIDPSDLRLIERAAKSSSPPLTSSYFIVKAATARAKTLLRAS